jgi:trehalose synthase
VLRAQEQLRGRVVWNVNATASAGGVAEMLHVLVAYGRGAGVDTRWLVLDGDAEFFAITKRLHNFLHGSVGDEGSLDGAARTHYEEVLARNLDELLQRVHRQDIVILHDPQTAGLVPGLVAAGARVVWRCHVGRDTPNELHDLGWAFLRPYLAGAHAFVFSRSEYVPAWVPADLVWVVPPSLDPFSAKNADLDADVVSSSLRVAGLVSTSPPTSVPESGSRRPGHGGVRQRNSLIIDGPPVPGHARVVLQVSRWDRLKDMEGVLRGFAENLSRLPEDAHLVLAGPEVAGVSDDPEGAEVLASCLEQRESLDTSIRRRIHLTALPMDDVDENAHLVNALQRHASVVVQKSLVEGFGLTVTEPMWKGRPVIASAVGGIQDQIDHGVNGLLLDDPTDLDGMAKGVDALLRDPETAEQLGRRAHQTVLDRFLGDRHLMQYGELFASLIEG